MTTSPQCRTRDGAMLETSSSHGDRQRRDSTRDDRGMTALSRSTSPNYSVAAAVNRSRDPPPPPRESYTAKPRRRSVEKLPQQSGGRRRRESRGRSKDRSDYSSAPLRPRSRHDSRDRIRPVDREFEHPPHPRYPHPSSQRDKGDSWQEHDRERVAQRSPSSAKRARSSSPTPAGFPPKKTKRDHSPRRRDTGQTKSQRPARPRRDPPSSSRRPRSLERRERHQRQTQRAARSRSVSPSRRFSSRSPRRRNQNYQLPPHPRRSPPRYRSKSPHRTSPASSRSRHPSPASRNSRPPTSSDNTSRRRPTPDFGSYSSSYPPPRSPQDQRGSKSGKRNRVRDGPGPSKKFQPTSGANNIEVNMSARGGYRGGFNPPMQPAFQGQHDPRAFSQSSGHATPNSSYHGSPPSHSPYGGSGRGWANQQPFSPQQQYPPAYPHGAYGAPNGPQGHFHSNPGHSHPYPPTGPASQYPQGPYRGSHRGGPGGFRGGPFNAGRGGNRGGSFKNTHWNSNAPAGNGRGQHGPGHENVSSNTSPHASPNGSERRQSDGDIAMVGSENPFRPSKDLQVEDTVKPDALPAGEQMPPPSRPPPTGPQSSKFSFAFKASKPAVATPKPEISSKFNAAPPRREPPPDSHRNRNQDRDRDRGALPRNVPTEPASARPRGGDPRQKPPPPPRVRIVKKKMKRRKPRRTLSPEPRASDSIFFRKPGNESVIGSGTYGKVFKGLNVYTKRLVALKRIRMEGERDGFPVTAVREVKLLQSLKHTNIVNLREVMVEKNDCFMVFEYLSHDLTGILNHPTFKLDAAQKKHLAKQMFEGLDYLHKRGVLHRDIKAANILVSSDGILKLADFGLARFYAKHHQLDYTNRVITIWYRSPELLLGETQYGPPVDIWSAACVMVEIFTRAAIFPGDGSEISQLDKIYAVLGTPNRTEWPNLVEMPWFALLRQGYKKPNTFAEKYKERLPPAAFDLLAAMLRYDPAKRPSAAEVLEHPYFTTEQPPPRQAIELQNLDGDWHEFESKALRRENERKEKEAKRAQAKEAASGRERDRKRPVEESESHRSSKKPHIDPRRSSQAESAANSSANAAPRKA